MTLPYKAACRFIRVGAALGRPNKTPEILHYT